MECTVSYPGSVLVAMHNKHHLLIGYFHYLLNCTEAGISCQYPPFRSIPEHAIGFKVVNLEAISSTLASLKVALVNIFEQVN